MSALQLWLQNHNRKLTQDAIDEALMEYITHVEKQRDELLAALETVMSIDVKGHELRDRLQFSPVGRAILEQVNAAIASIKGAE